MQKERIFIFQCPSKYKNKPYETKNEFYNKKEYISKSAVKVTEFTDSAINYILNLRILQNYKSPSFACNYRLQVMKMICSHSPNSGNIFFLESHAIST